MTGFLPGDVVLLRGKTIGIVVESPLGYKNRKSIGPSVVWGRWWHFGVREEWSEPLYSQPQHVKLIGHFTAEDLTDFPF